MRILMVCLGNICRSPLAEGILRSKVEALHLDWQVDSAGTGYWHTGERPDRRSISVAQQFGVDITDQRARQFKPEDFEHFDKIFVMDRSNHRDVIRLAQVPEHAGKVDLILNQVFPGENREVPDPYYDDGGFEAVYRMLDAACDKIVQSLR